MQRLAHIPPFKHLLAQTGQRVMVRHSFQLDHIKVPELFPFQHGHNLGGNTAALFTAGALVSAKMVMFGGSGKSADVAPSGDTTLLVVTEGVHDGAFALTIWVVQLEEGRNI